MSEEQLSALITKLNEDADLKAKFESTKNHDDALAVAKGAGFDISEAEIRKIIYWWRGGMGGGWVMDLRPRPTNFWGRLSRWFDRNL